MAGTHDTATVKATHVVHASTILIMEGLVNFEHKPCKLYLVSYIAERATCFLTAQPNASTGPHYELQSIG